MATVGGASVSPLSAGPTVPGSESVRPGKRVRDARRAVKDGAGRRYVGLHPLNLYT